MPCAGVLFVGPRAILTPSLLQHLEHNGFDVLQSVDGTSALHRVAQGKADLVVLCAPDASGTEHGSQHGIDACRFLRRLRLRSNVGVIVLSREHDEAVRLYFLDSGADDCLIWPFSPSELAARMRAVLRRTLRDVEAPACCVAEAEEHVDDR